MALQPCRECKTMVSDQAATCPSCGITQPVPLNKKTSWTAIFGAIGLFIAIMYYFASVDQSAKNDKIAEANYLKEHPLTPAQTAANAHFQKCENLKQLNNAQISDQQKATLLVLERCPPDRRDDPRQFEATYPWNGDREPPWKGKATQSAVSPTDEIQAWASQEGRRAAHAAFAAGKSGEAATFDATKAAGQAALDEAQRRGLSPDQVWDMAIQAGGQAAFDTTIAAGQPLSAAKAAKKHTEALLLETKREAIGR